MHKKHNNKKSPLQSQLSQIFYIPFPYICQISSQ